MPISALPPAPQPTDTQAQFNTKAFNLVAALSTFVTQTNAVETAVDADAATAAAAASTATSQASTATAAAGTATTQASAAAASAAAADASAQAAAAIAGAFVGTSTSSNIIGTGNKTFSTQTGEQYSPGIWMTAVSQANASNFMFGQVVAYSGTTLVINVQATGGTGTFSDWNLSLTGPRGPAGTGITDQAVGFSATGGTTPRTLTVDEDATTSQLVNDVVQVINTNTNAVRNRVYVLTASLTLTLPASPSAGHRVSFSNRSGTTTPVIARNGQPIMGLAEDMTLDTATAAGTLTYADATRGWVLR